MKAKEKEKMAQGNCWSEVVVTSPGSEGKKAEELANQKSKRRVELQS